MTTPGFNLTASRRTATTMQGVGKLRCRGRQALALWVAIAMLSIPALVVYGAPVNSTLSSTGHIMVEGTVRVNSTPARSGQTLFSGSTISTDEDSQSLIDFANSARLRVNPETSLTVGFSDNSFTGSLFNGSLDYVSPAGARTEIATAEGTIVANTAQRSQFRVQVVDGTTYLTVTTGSVSLKNSGKVRTVSAGESASTGPNAVPPQQNNMSGKKKAGLIILFGGIAGVIIWLIVRDDDCKVFSPAGSTNCVG